MKNSITLLIATFFCTLLIAQTPGNVVVYAEDGSSFTLYLNGEQQNDFPQNNVRATYLTQEFYSARIVFEDPTKGEFTKSMACAKGIEVVYAIKKNNKGEYVLRYASESPLPSAPTTTVTTPSAPSQNVQATNPNQQLETVTTTTTVEGDDFGGENVSINMNMGGTNFGVNVSVPGTTTQTTTTRTTTTTTTSQMQTQQSAQPVKQEGCAVAMASSDYNSALNSIKSKSFEDSKMTLAKQIARTNCLSAVQVKGIMQSFTFEESRLDFAKFAYDFTVDRNNYYLLNDAFQFELSIDELNEYIESR